MKKCTECTKEKTIDDFYTYRKGLKVYYKPACKVCSKKRVSKWQKDNPERHCQNVINYQKRKKVI